MPLYHICKYDGVCPAGYYCDPGSNLCHPCADICQGYEHQDCKHFCPDYGFDASSTVSTFMTATTSSAVPLIASSNDIYFVVILTVICIVVLITISVIVCFIYVSRQNARMPDIPYGSYGLPVTRTTSSVIQSPQDDIETHTLPHVRHESLPSQSTQPTAKRSDKPQEEFKQLEIPHTTRADVHTKAEYIDARPKDPNRTTKSTKRSSSSESDVDNKHKNVHTLSVSQARNTSKTFESSDNLKLKLEPVGTRQTVAKKDTSSSSASALSPRMISIATNTEIDPELKQEIQSDTGSKDNDPPQTARSKSKPTKQDLSKLNPSSDEVQPLLLKTKDSEKVRKSATDENEGALEDESFIPTKIQRKSLLPKGKRGTEPRFDIDVYSMELEPEDKDPLEKAHQRRHRKLQQKEKAEAAAVEEEKPEEEQAVKLNIAAALASIKVRKTDDDPPKEDLDDSITQPKGVRPSLLFQQTSKNDAEPLTPSIQEDAPDFLLSHADNRDKQAQNNNKQTPSAVITPQSISDAMTEHDQIIRSQLRRMAFVRDHRYHGINQPIEVYVDQDTESFWALSELVQITGELPSRYRVLRNPTSH